MQVEPEEDALTAGRVHLACARERVPDRRAVATFGCGPPRGRRCQEEGALRSARSRARLRDPVEVLGTEQRLGRLGLAVIEAAQDGPWSEAPSRASTPSSRRAIDLLVAGSRRRAVWTSLEPMKPKRKRAGSPPRPVVEVGERQRVLRRAAGSIVVGGACSSRGTGPRIEPVLLGRRHRDRQVARGAGSACVRARLGTARRCSHSRSRLSPASTAALADDLARAPAARARSIAVGAGHRVARRSGPRPRARQWRYSSMLPCPEKTSIRNSGARGRAVRRESCLSQALPGGV